MKHLSYVLLVASMAGCGSLKVIDIDRAVTIDDCLEIQSSGNHISLGWGSATINTGAISVCVPAGLRDEDGDGSADDGSGRPPCPKITSWIVVIGSDTNGDGRLQEDEQLERQQRGVDGGTWCATIEEIAIEVGLGANAPIIYGAKFGFENGDSYGKAGVVRPKEGVLGGGGFIQEESYDNLALVTRLSSEGGDVVSYAVRPMEPGEAFRACHDASPFRVTNAQTLRMWVGDQMIHEAIRGRSDDWLRVTTDPGEMLRLAQRYSASRVSGPLFSRWGIVWKNVWFEVLDDSGHRLLMDRYPTFGIGR